MIHRNAKFLRELKNDFTPVKGIIQKNYTRTLILYNDQNQKKLILTDFF
jgi:hypothetical protein